MVVSFHPSVKVLLFILVLYLVLSLFTFINGILPRKFKTGLTPKEFGYEFKEVEFKTADGLQLKGWFIPAKSDKAVIVLHGYPFDKGNIIAASHFLAKKYNLLLFDFRSFGESEGRVTTVGYKEQEDVKAAVLFLQKRNFTEIGIHGFSLGAATVLMARPKGVKAIVADSPYASMDHILEQVYFLFPWKLKWPLMWLTKLYAKIFLGIDVDKKSPLTEISRLRVPILLIHGERDSQIPVENSRLLYEASNKKQTELWVIEGVEHGFSYAEQKEGYEERVLKFFDKNL